MKKILFSLCLLWASSLWAKQADSLLIQKHLQALTEGDYRNYHNIDRLNAVAAYIHQEFSRYADSVYYQEYQVEGQTYKNVIAILGSEHTKSLIVGAHYDVCGNQQGADDNASGVVGLLELARMLQGEKLSQRIELVAYTLEEPPYFRTEYMGSYIHAKSLAEQNRAVYGMISLEMIAYFKQEKHTQDYPFKPLSLIYGKKGNYITLVSKFGKGKFARKFSRTFMQKKSIRTQKFTGPRALPGIDFSDHLNYWQFGFSALMITDTAFYRNKNYHQSSDIVQSLDTASMAKVINSVHNTLLAL